MNDAVDEIMPWAAKYSSLNLRRAGSVLYAAIDRPENRNALSDEVRDELDNLVAHLESDLTIRLLVLDSANGMFCSGGDLKGFNRSFETPLPADGAPDPVSRHNRAFGEFLERFDALPQVTVARVEGAAMAGALGLLCVCDAVVTMADAKFGMTETSLGIIPAQIAPFVVSRIGLASARVIGLTGRRFDGAEAARIGLADFSCTHAAQADGLMAEIVQGVLKCAPNANAMTKSLLRRAAVAPVRADLLDWASARFVEAMRGEEGQEGVRAFLQKRRPHWAV